MNHKSLSLYILFTLVIFSTLSIQFVGMETVFGDGVVDTITVGEGPHHITYNPDNDNMYVANLHSSTVSVIDSSTNTVIDTITVGFRPFGIAYNPDNSHMYVTTTGSGTIYVIDSSTNMVVDIESVGESPLAIAYNANNGDMYVTNFNPGTVLVIDSSTNMVVDTIKVGDGPWAIAHNPFNGNIYTVNQQSGDVSVIDSTTNAVIDTIEVENGPFGIAYNSDNGNMYVTNYESDSVSVIDSTTNAVIDTIEVENGPFGIAYNSDNGNMYIANSFSGTVSVIDSSTNTVIDTIEAENGIWGVEHNPDNGDTYITSTPSGTVLVLGKLPLANAGPDQTVDSGATVQLDGSGSSANGGSPIANYQWTQTSGPTVTLDDPTSATPSFTAPQTEVQENIVFQLVVTNEQGVESEPDSVTITVNPIVSPIADAGTNQTVISGDIVQLDGTGSSANGGSPIVEYQWTQIGGPSVTLDDSNSATPTFTAPDTEEQMNLVFQLVVTNEQGVESQPDSVTITVNPVIPPIADAGHDQVVESESIVELDGSNSSDPNNSPLTYSWIQTEGPEVVLSNSNSSNPTFEAPKTNEEINLVFQLTVTNEEGITSEPDEVIITVKPVSMPPPPEEQPRTINDIIKGIIQNPLNVTNSIDSANEIRNILTDNNRDNDQIVCDLIDSEDEYTSNIREILNC